MKIGGTQLQRTVGNEEESQRQDVVGVHRTQALESLRGDEEEAIDGITRQVAREYVRVRFYSIACDKRLTSKE